MISVIVPCYDQAQYLSEALESVIDQTYSNWECIIINDGSTDNTEEIANQYLKKDSRFKYLYKVNGGLSSARNAGINMSAGQYILPLDADDKIGNTYLEKAVHLFENNAAIKLVYAKAEKFGVVNETWDLSPYTYHNMLLNNNIYCSAIFRRSDFDDTSGYDENMKNGYEDWDFWLQLLNEHDLVYQMDQVNFYCRQKGYSSVYSNHELEIQGRKYIYKKHINKYLTHLPDPRYLVIENKMLINNYKNSYEYKLGNRILWPIRKLINLFK